MCRREPGRMKGGQFVVVMCRKLRSRADSTPSMRSYNEARWVEEEHPGS